MVWPCTKRMISSLQHPVIDDDLVIDIIDEMENASLLLASAVCMQGAQKAHRMHMSVESEVHAVLIQQGLKGQPHALELFVVGPI